MPDRSYNPDYRFRFLPSGNDEPLDRMERDFVQNLLFPTFDLIYASAEAHERNRRWREEHGAKCEDCGTALVVEYLGTPTVIPATWQKTMAEFRAVLFVCNDCLAARQPPPAPWQPPAPPI